jgi:SAM-dependent methyltransferase
MLCPLSAENSTRLLRGFEEAGYSEAKLRKHLGSVELPSRSLRNEPRLLDRTREPTALNMLLRWFWLGHPVAIESAENTLPEDMLGLLLESELLHRSGDQFATSVMLLPVDDFLVASDHPSAFERSERDLVLWPNPTSKFLGRFTVNRPSGATLDVGTGCGILSLWAARHSHTVVATDLNPRAASFVAFNARLNGIDNIEVLTGEGFDPVEGRAFDLILSNPPFFISPRREYLFCDNPMDLDQLCRRFTQQAPRYLNEGGYFQMLCEWAQVSGQPWEERVAEWLAGSGCDAWVMKGLTQAPEEYAQQRIRETTSDPGQDAELYNGYMAYYADRRVEAIHDGLMVMRKRSGDNWVRIEEVPKTPTGELGAMVLSTFASHDFARKLEQDEDLLAARLKFAPNVRLEQVCDQICGQSGGRWHAESLTLRLVSGFPFHMLVQPLVAEFLVRCDGSRSAGEAIDLFAAAADAPVETVRRECLAMFRKLIERGFMIESG